VVTTPDSGIVVGGETGSTSGAAVDFFILKYTSAGALSWAKRYGGAVSDEGRVLTKTGDGGFVMAGWTTTYGAGQYDLLVMKFTSTGTIEWGRTFGGTNYDGGWSAIQCSDGGYAAVGPHTAMVLAIMTSAS